MDQQSISGHLVASDVYGLILQAIEAAGLSADTVTVEQLAPLDHFHARGFRATAELADALPINRDDHLIDIGCGLGGPARYFALRFGCRVSGVDLTPSYVEAAIKLTGLLKMDERVSIELGDGHSLAYGDAMFDGGYAQHVTMNVADRSRFYAEAFRVLKPGAFFALSEHGLGPQGRPFYPTPWSENGGDSFLVPPADTVALLERTGFEDITVEHSGAQYLAGYKRAIELAGEGRLPPLGTHLLMGETALAKTENAARNIEERRTDPFQVICRKPS